MQKNIAQIRVHKRRPIILALHAWFAADVFARATEKYTCCLEL